MYSKPFLAGVDAAVTTAGCCWISGSIRPIAIKTPLGTIETPTFETGRMSTTLCDNGRAFPTCSIPGAPCVIVVTTETATIIVSGQP